MRRLDGRDNRPVNEETIAAHAKAIVEHTDKTIGFRTKDGACEPGPVLRLDKDPDGEAVRLVRRYHCRSIGKAGVEVDFRPFFEDGPAKIFLLGIFFADGKTEAHTFTGRPITNPSGDVSRARTRGPARSLPGSVPSGQYADPVGKLAELAGRRRGLARIDRTHDRRARRSPAALAAPTPGGRPASEADWVGRSFTCVGAEPGDESDAQPWSKQ